MKDYHPAARKTIFYSALSLALATVIIASLHFATRGLASDNRLVNMFDLLSEGNVPTWFASILWFMVTASALCSFMSERLSAVRPRFAAMWLVIAAVFMIASADEVGQIHEQVGTIIEDYNTTNGALDTVVAAAQEHQDAPNSPWIAYYLPILVLFAISAGGFVWQRLWKYKLLLACCIIAADCYALAIAFDKYQGLTRPQQQPLAAYFHMTREDMLMLTLVTEEIIEDVGTALLVIAFSGYAAQQLALVISAARIAAARAPEAIEAP